MPNTATMIPTLHVHYDDGTEVEVDVGQREMAAWEMAGHGSSIDAGENKPMAFFRFLAYHGLRRAGRLPGNKVKGAAMPFEVWSAQVDQVMPENDDEPAEPAEVGPTTPDQPQED